MPDLLFKAKDIKQNYRLVLTCLRWRFCLMVNDRVVGVCKNQIKHFKHTNLRTKKRRRKKRGKTEKNYYSVKEKK